MVIFNVNVIIIVVFLMGLLDLVVSIVNLFIFIIEKISEGVYFMLIKFKRNILFIVNSSFVLCFSFFGKYFVIGCCIRVMVISIKGIMIRKKVKENKNCLVFGDN